MSDTLEVTVNAEYPAWMTPGHAADIIQAEVKDAGTFFVWDLNLSTYRDPRGEEQTQRVLIAWFDFEGSVEDLKGLLSGLAVVLNQDCVAWAARDLSAGGAVPYQGLAGPHAAKWEPFNPEYFKYLSR